MLEQDPRPAYQDIPERIYVMNIADYEVQFRIENKCATVIKLSTIWLQIESIYTQKAVWNVQTAF